MTTEPNAEDKPTSMIFDHCVRVYEEMLQQSRQEPDEGLVYEGHLTKLVTGQLGLATPYYTTIMQHLKVMGCVEQIRRGGGTAGSRWRLLRAPDEEAFRSHEGMNRARGGKTAALEQQIRDLNKRLLTAETDIGNLKALIDRLVKLHNQMSIQAARGEMAYKELRKHSHAIQVIPGEAPVLLEAQK